MGIRSKASAVAVRVLDYDTQNLLTDNKVQLFSIMSCQMAWYS
jgi:hypothetical protein